MALTGSARFASYERSRTVIYVSKKVTDDSAFPFKPGDELVVTVDPNAKLLVFQRAETPDGHRREPGKAKRLEKSRRGKPSKA